MVIKSGVKVKDGDGTNNSPYRLNEINYENTLPQKDNTYSGMKLVDNVTAGQYVDINVEYINKYGYNGRSSDKGWRVLGIESETNEVKLISTGHPLTYYHPSSDSDDTRDASIAEMLKISTQTINVDPDSLMGYRKNGFSTNNIISLFNNNSVFSGISIPDKDAIESIPNNDLRKEGKSYWVATGLSFGRLYYINYAGSVKYGEGMAIGVRPVVKIKTDVTIKDGTGTFSEPFRLNGIDY